MKKLLYCAAALAVAFFAGSCQQEKLEPVAESNAVTFTVEAPAGIQTKAKIADGLNVNELIYEVWLTETLGDLENKAQKLYQGKTTMQVVGGVNKATLTLDLVNDQKFTVLFWAQVKDTGVYDTDELNAVTYTKAANLENAYAANDERLAAFYGVAYVKDTYHVTKEEAYTSGTVTLRRPFAQINLGTLNTSIGEESTTGYKISLEESNMILNEVPTVFNVVTSEVSGYHTMQFKMYDVPAKDPANDTLTVNNKAYWYAGMNYVFAGVNDKRNITLTYNIKTKLNGGMEALVTNEVPNVPLRENYRTNIIGNLLTSKTDYDIIVDATFNEPSEEVYVTDVYDNTTLETALRVKDENIVINLAGKEVTKASVVPVEYTVNISSTVEKYYFGGPDTKSITINANGNKINFIHNDGDWNYIRCVNEEAKWVINDAILTNSGKNDGPWNRHDIRFYNAVELNNVTSDKAIALLNDGKLNDVEITEEGAVYGLWITSEGQTVDVDGLTITSERGIKIADEYVDSPAKVTLNVANAVFTTTKKAAVLVTSTAGAEIVWGNGNNIEAVAADKINAVWVDEERIDYYDEVAVTGATKRLESADALADGFYQMSETEYAINSLTGFKAFAASVNNGTTYKGATVKLEADIDLQSEPWTPIGMNADSNKKFYGTFDGQNHTISNLKVNTAKGYTAAGLFGALNGTAKNFTIDGASVSHISTGALTDNGIAVVAGSIYGTGNIEGVTVLNATVNGNRYVGAIAGYVYGNIKNCTVKDVTLTATPDKETGSYDNGDKVGAVAGYFASESVYAVSGNVVENATLVGYRDMGVVVGTANGADAVYDNTVKGKNFVTVDRNFFYGDKDDNAGEVVGRITAGNLGQNTVEGTVTITHPVASAEINAAIKDGGDYTFEEDVEGQASSTNGYGKTGITQSNGGTIDGNGHVLEVPGANSTWDSAINTTGGTIKNLTVAAGFRGIFISHNSTNCSKVYIENVVIDGPVYTISCDQGTNNGLEAVGSTFNGWTSYAGTLGEVKFTECSFGEGAGYSFCRPYAPTTFVECEFEAGYQMDPRAAVVFVDCTVDGQALTTDNLSSLVTSNIQNVTSVNATEQFAPGAWVDDEGKYTATSETGIENAIKAGASEVNLVAGEYSFPAGSVKSGTTINCEEGVVFKGTSSLNVNGATVVGGTFQNKSGYAVSGTINGTFKNCTFDSGEALRWCYTNPGESVVFENCVIKTNFRGFHFDTMDGNVTFKDCEINGFNAYGGAGTVTFEGCTFGCDKSSYNGLNIYANTVLKDCTFLFKSGKTNFVDMEGEGQTLSITNCSATLDGNPVELSEYVGGSKLSVNTVTIDGVQLNK